MEYNVNLNFNIEAESETEAIEKAKDIITIEHDTLIDNLTVTSNNDDLLCLKSYVLISKYREQVMEALITAGLNGLMPTEISHETGILQNHISMVLKQLYDKDLITCINPRTRKGKIYRCTNVGFMVGDLLWIMLNELH